MITGNASSDNVTVETEISKIYDPQGGGTNGSDIVYGGIMRVSGLPNYVVHVANVKDDLNVNALAGNDVINVKSITGPTRITDSAGNHTINVFAKKILTQPDEVSGCFIFSPYWKLYFAMMSDKTVHSLASRANCFKSIFT